MTRKKGKRNQPLYSNSQVKAMVRAYRDGKNKHFDYILTLPIWTRIKVAIAAVFKVKVNY